jgi:hypothetical protein
MTLLIEICGWTGALLLLLAYGLVSNGRVKGSSPVYQWLNIAGAGCIAANSGWNGAFPSAALNVVWIAIGVAALLRHPSA